MKKKVEGRREGLHEGEKKESRGARIFEQGSTHVLPGSHVSKKSQIMRCRISSECAGTENEKDTNNDFNQRPSECEGEKMRNQLWKQEIGIGIVLLF